MGAVVEAVDSAVSNVVDAVGDVSNAVVDTATTVVDTVSNTAATVVDSAVNDPIGTIAKVAAVATGNLELLPVISAADTVANGGSLADAALSAGIAYVAPTVASGASDALANTAIGAALQSASDSLPGAVSQGVSAAALNTAAGVLKGQDLETALAGGVGAGVGNAVGSELAGSDLDTGNKGLNTLIGNAAGAATTAALNGNDVSTAIANSVAPGILGLGAGAAYNSTQSNTSSQPNPSVNTAQDNQTAAQDNQTAPQGVQTLLASNTPNTGAGSTVSDSGNPNAAMLTALQNNAQVPANPVAPNSNGGPDTNGGLVPLGNNIFMLQGGSLVNADGEPVNAMGQRVDANGNVISTDLGGDTSNNLSNLVGQTVGGNQTSDNQTNDNQTSNNQTNDNQTNDNQTSNNQTSNIVGLSGTLGDQPGDYPADIQNLPDGSTKVIESDGSYSIFNVDGTVDRFNADGTPFGSGASQSSDNNASDNQSTGNQSTDNQSTDNNTSENQTTADTTQGSTDLTNLVNTLIPGAVKPVVNAVKPVANLVANNPLTTAALIGGGLGALSSLSNTQTNQNAPAGGFASGPSGYDFAWNQNIGSGPVNGVYIGTNMLNPTYTKRGANGGLMTAPQYIQPTLNQNGIQMSSGGDPTNAVQMYAMGGIASLGSYSDGGRMLKGPGDGMSDDIPATIGGRQPARLANEEFVIPADVVSHLGNGSSEAGAKVLYEMMDRVRKARTGTTKQGKQINPAKFMPKVRS